MCMGQMIYPDVQNPYACKSEEDIPFASVFEVTCGSILRMTNLALASPFLHRDSLAVFCKVLSPLKDPLSQSRGVNCSKNTWESPQGIQTNFDHYFSHP